MQARTYATEEIQWLGHFFVTTGLEHRQNYAVGCQLEREGAAHNQPYAHCMSAMKAVRMNLMHAFN